MVETNNRKLIIWTSSIPSLYDSMSVVGGFSIQMYLWRSIFIKNGWSVKSFYIGQLPQELDKGYFIKDFCTRMWYNFLYFFYAGYIIMREKPNLIITRGSGNRNLYYIALWCKWFNIKLVNFGGSDVDLNFKEKNIPFSKKINNILFRKGLRILKYYIPQNKVQEDLLGKLFPNIKSLVIPNIWGKITLGENNDIIKKDYILWVSNFRFMKRPEMVVEIASKLKDYNFIMIGAPVDKELYERFQKKHKTIDNIEYLGKMSFDVTNSFFKGAKILLCTSSFEGFPNTFLQAWNEGIPVVSSVDPNNLLREKNLGLFCEDINDFTQNIKEIYSNRELYDNLCENVRDYFSSHHSDQYGYDKLVDFLEEE